LTIEHAARSIEIKELKLKKNKNLIKKISYLLTFPLLYIIGRCTVFRPGPLSKHENDVIDICLSSSPECLRIEEKTSRASMSQLLANLLLIQHPEHISVEVRASKAHNKEIIESTLKNMRFKDFTVHLP
jgi:hypothetical protein